ncbi:protein translocase subunit SecD [Candidatus Sumerlaeota bacterium]|nr:protein translocase subunit SecD [Candidatus Sumerlaeota bacterium]
MQRESNWRNWTTLIVTLLCFLFMSPTLRYVTFVFNEQPPVEADYSTKEEFEEKTKAYEDKRAALQRKSIKLGLDLIGGVDVLLQIDEDQARTRLLEKMKDDLLYRMRNDVNPISAVVDLTPDKRELSVSLREPRDARRASVILNRYVEGGTLSEFDQAGFERTGKTEIALAEPMLRRELSDAIANAEKTIRNRVDEFGVTQPSVSLQPETFSIRVQVPGEKDPEYVISQIIKPAQLAFYMLYEDPDGMSNESLADQLYEKVETEDRFGKTVEVFRLREGSQLPQGCIGMEGVDTDTGPGGQVTSVDRMYIVKRQVAMDGSNLRNAGVRTNPASLDSPIYVSFEFNAEGARALRKLTKENQGKRMAVALDKKIYSAPVIEEVIPDGAGIIRGSFSYDEANDLALVLKAGALPADLKPVEKRAVGATLGATSIRESVRALGIASACITVFMILYYGTAGLISIVALVLNMLLIVACLDLFNATLTLSGIGGMILTIGMAVDANVLIYERMREELARGRELRAAIRAGFRRAFSVIFDSNLTTLLAAFVLLQFGEGTVKGFALTMVFGLIANLFTGLTVTYAICSLWFRWRGKLSLGFLRFFQNTKWDFIGMRYVSWSASGLAILISLSVLLFRGPQYAVDFEGGVLTEVRLNNVASSDDRSNEIRDALRAVGVSGEQSRVQKISREGFSDYLLRIPLLTPEGQTEGDVSYTEERVTNDGLRGVFGQEGVTVLSTSSVGTEVGQTFREIAILVIIGASICILAYLWFRFELVFGIAAVIALVHDITIVTGLITILNLQISLDVVSALLILLGFSVNDTIVIFDRIRENSHMMFGKPFKQICNDAMNVSLSRTVITSGTVLVVMTIMYFFGGRSLQPFALVMIIGGVVGTYSSDFIAAPFVFWWNQRQHGRLVEQLGRKPATPKAVEEEMGIETAPATASASTSTSSQAPRRRGRR